MTDPKSTRTEDSDDDGQLANQGPVPAAPEDSADTGEEQGDLTAQAGPDREKKRD